MSSRCHVIARPAARAVAIHPGPVGVRLDCFVVPQGGTPRNDVLKTCLGKWAHDARLVILNVAEQQS